MPDPTPASWTPPVDPIPPPHNEEAERQFLGCVLLDPAFALKAAEKSDLCIDDFYVNSHQALYAHLLAEFRSRGGIETSLLVPHLRQIGKLSEVGGVEGLEKCVQSVTSAAMAGAFADTIRDLSVKRDVVISSLERVAEARNGVVCDDIATHLEADAKRIRRLTKKPDTDTGYGFTTADAILSEPETPEDFLWPGYVARGRVSLFSGDPKSGKSTLMYGWLAALRNGQDWLGREKGPGPRFLIVSEENKREIGTKLRQFGLRDAIVLPRGGTPDGTRWEAEVEAFGDRAVKEGCAGVLVDTLSGKADIEDENDSADTRRALKPLLNLAARSNLAVAVVHHAPKTAGGLGRNAKATDFVRGSGNIAATVDAIIGVALWGEVTDPRRVLVSQTRFNLPPARVSLELVRESGKHDRYELAGLETKPDRDWREIDAKILRVLPEKPPGKILTAIREKAGVQAAVVLPRLVAMSEAGKVLCSGTGEGKDRYRYTITELGKKFSGTEPS